MRWPSFAPFAGQLLLPQGRIPCVVADEAEGGVSEKTPQMSKRRNRDSVQ